MSNLTISECWKTGSSLARWLWLRVSAEVVVRCQSRVQYLKGVLPRWLTHVAVGRRTQFFPMEASPQGCLRALVTWELASPRVSNPFKRNYEQAGSCSTFYDSFWSHMLFLPLYTIHLKWTHFYSLSLAHTQWEENYTTHIQGKSIKKFVTVEIHHKYKTLFVLALLTFKSLPFLTDL